jgi:hypothetical protein
MKTKIKQLLCWVQRKHEFDKGKYQYISMPTRYKGITAPRIVLVQKTACINCKKTKENLFVNVIDGEKIVSKPIKETGIVIIEK